MQERWNNWCSKFNRKRAAYDQNRFEANQDLVNVNNLIAQLRAKEKELKADAQKNGLQSDDYRKHVVVEALLARIDEIIKPFNEAKVETVAEDDEEAKEKSKNKEMLEICQVLKELMPVIDKAGREHRPILSAMRNNKREMANNAVKGGVYAGSFAAAFFVPITLLVSAPAAYLAGRAANNKVKNLTGLEDNNARTMTIVDALNDAVTKAHQNIGLKLQAKNLYLVKNVK